MHGQRNNPSRPAGGDDVVRVKDATDIVRLVGEHIALKPKGREFVGLCPFHDDRTPSMFVSPAKQIYKCFSCNAAGDCLTFAQKYFKMEFREALEFLAERAGVTLTRLHPGREHTEGAPEVSRADLLRACQLACEFYSVILAHPQHGALARDVLERRAISDAMRDAFRLGAAPDRWDGLVTTLEGKGVPAGVLHGAGLAKPREHGAGSFDMLRNRLIFPICDGVGRVIAFGGRKLRDEDEPKYLNSPETRLFDKSKTLYALHLASKEVQRTRTAIICEGYTDVIACHQAGFSNAMATLGTALTREHARVLRRMCDRVVLLFDGDEAGQRATDRAAEVFFAEPLDVCIVSLASHTDAKDPDELLKREGGAEVFRAALDTATDLLDFRMARVAEKTRGAGLAARTRAINEELERLAQLGLASVEPIRRKLIIKRLAQLAGVDDATILAALPLARAPRASGEASPAEEALPLHRISLMTPEHLLGCLLCDGSLWGLLTEGDKDLLAPASYRFEVLRLVAQAIHDLGEDGQEPSLPAVLARSEDSTLREAAVTLMSRVDEQTMRDPQRLHRFFHECMRRLRADALTAPAPSIEPKPAPLATLAGDPDPHQLAARMDALRRAHREMGPDRRRVPRG